MQKCEITLSQLGFVSDIDNSDSLRRIVKRLPTYLRVKWVDVAHSIMESGREPRFSDLSKFIDQKVRVANSTYGLDLVRESKSHVSHKSHGSHKESEVKTKVTTLTTQNKKVETSQRTSCVCCSGTLGLKRYTAVSILFDLFCSVRSSIRFPYFRFGSFLFLATLMQEVNKLKTDV